MNLRQIFSVVLALLCLAAPAWATSFQHVIVVVQENRTPDNLFQGLCANPDMCAVPPGDGQYDIQTAAWYDKTSETGTTDPTPVPFGLGYDLSHKHSSFVTLCDFDADAGICMMDGGASIPCFSNAEQCPTDPAYGYVDNSDGSIQPYIDLALGYGWANYMFQTNQGPSYAAHQFLFGATSAPSADDDAAGTFVAEMASRSENGKRTGCASVNSKAFLINAAGQEFAKIVPCFDHQTLSDLLDQQGVSWRYYTNNANGVWTAPNSISHICGQVAKKKCKGTEYRASVDINQTDVLSDISTNCNLRGVSWVIPDVSFSDHMGFVANTGGPSWVAQIVNAVGTSPCTNVDGSSYWNSTAIIVLWDDWGGWYDHEAPTIEAYPQGGYQMGLRVPLIFVSAYTPAGFISNTPEDFGSLARFIEQNFAIPEGSLTFADARSSSDLTEFVSTDAPRSFHPIHAPLSQKHFLETQPSTVSADDDK